MIRLQFILIALVAGFSPLFAGEAERPQHNFLFVIDSSSSMSRHKTAAIKLVRQVIESRFEDQIEPGDSIDIWTYDTENNLRGFPPQIWKSADAARIADAAAQYLEKFQFKAKSDFSNVATDLDLLVPQTKALLIVVITDGESPFSGIKLDLDINEYLAKKGKLGPSQDPFLISISAIKGALRTWTAHFGKGVPDLATLPERSSSTANIAKTGLAQDTEGSAKAKDPAKPEAIFATQPRATWSPTPSPLTMVPNNDFIFNFPPGTKITPVEEPKIVPKVGEKSLAALAAERLAKAAELRSNKVSTANLEKATEKQIVQLDSNKTNSKVVVGSIQTNLAARTVISESSSAQPASAAVQQASVSSNITSTNFVLAGVATNSPLKVNSATTNQSARAAVAVSNLSKPNFPQNSKESKGESELSGAGTSVGSLSAHGMFRRVVYGSVFTGGGCVLVGCFLIYRRFKRPSESIISRSLLQR